jgi:hypothetical protein
MLSTHCLKGVKMSVLLKIAGRPIVEQPEPIGCYDDAAQLWRLSAESGETLSIESMGTMSPTTYSATTGTGRDRDMDDRGY